jgi:hypothetical protein
MPPAGPQAQGWTGKCNSGHCQCLAEVGFIPSPSARTGLADLALRAKVVQTVVCSTFTRRAKPATQRVADGEGMNPGKGGAYAPIPKVDEHQDDEHLNSPGCTRDCRPVPRVYGLTTPVFPPPCVLRGCGWIFPAPARGPPHLWLACH